MIIRVNVHTLWGNRETTLCPGDADAALLSPLRLALEDVRPTLSFGLAYTPRACMC